LQRLQDPREINGDNLNNIQEKEEGFEGLS
jgi:hypothetical protein